MITHTYEHQVTRRSFDRKDECIMTFMGAFKEKFLNGFLVEIDLF